MNKITKKAIRIGTWSLAICGVMVLLGFVSSSQQNMRCKEMIIRIDQGKGSTNFIDEKDVRTHIMAEGSAVEENRMGHIKTHTYEELIRNLSSVEHAEVFKTIDGTVVVEVQQREPIVRIINANSGSFYIDENGRTMPLSEKYTANVLIVHGHIRESLGVWTVEEIMASDSLSKISMLDDVFIMASYIRKNDFWRAQIQSVWVNSKGEMEIMPLVGQHKIIFGSVKNMKQKFKKLKLFYKKALNSSGWNRYATINLKYENQIVCTKKQ